MATTRASRTRIVNCIQLPNGLWRARYFPPRDKESGIKSDAINFYGKTAKEASDKRDEFKANGKNLAMDRTTSFKDIVSNTIVPAIERRVAQGGISYKHGETSLSLLNRFVVNVDAKKCPTIVKAKLLRAKVGLVDATIMAEYFEALRDDGVYDEGVHRIKQLLTKGLIPVRAKLGCTIEEMFTDVILPTVVTSREVPVFDEVKILSIPSDTKIPLEDRAFIAFLFTAQCRPSEMFALRWTDFNFDKKVVRFDKATRVVAKNQYATTQGGKGKKAGKIQEDKSSRDVDLPNSVIQLFLELAQQRADEGILSDYVFLSQNKLPLQGGSRFRRRWAAIKKSAGLPSGAGSPRFYSLKHLGNSYLLSNGVLPSVQAARMGHSSDRMAVTAYRKIRTAERLKAAQVFDRDIPVMRDVVLGIRDKTRDSKSLNAAQTIEE